LKRAGSDSKSAIRAVRPICHCLCVRSLSSRRPFAFLQQTLGLTIRGTIAPVSVLSLALVVAIGLLSLDFWVLHCFNGDISIRDAIKNPGCGPIAPMCGGEWRVATPIFRSQVTLALRMREHRATRLHSKGLPDGCRRASGGKMSIVLTIRCSSGPFAVPDPTSPVSRTESE
jgi:hypothetical protein